MERKLWINSERDKWVNFEISKKDYNLSYEIYLYKLMKQREQLKSKQSYWIEEYKGKSSSTQNDCYLQTMNNAEHDILSEYNTEIVIIEFL
jgi:hypothetical protein